MKRNHEDAKRMLAMGMTLALAAGMQPQAFAGPAEARAAATQVTEMKDGSTLYTFKDGKTAVEDKYGRATRVMPGTKMETMDGKTVTIQKDDSSRLENLLREGMDGGG